MSFLQWMDNSCRFDPFLLVSGKVDVVTRENGNCRDVIEEVFEFYIGFDELENFLDCGLVALIYVASVGPNLKGEDLDSGRGYVSFEVGILVSFVFVSFLNILLARYCEFKNPQSLFIFRFDHQVGF